MHKTRPPKLGFRCGSEFSLSLSLSHQVPVIDWTNPRPESWLLSEALRNMEEERERFILARTKPTPRIGEAGQGLAPFIATVMWAEWRTAELVK